MDKFEKILKEVGSDNLYKILHVEKFSEIEIVKKAYKKLIKKYHPDKNKEIDTRDIFEKVGKAYEVLHNAESKKQYDEFLARKEDKSKRIKTFSDKRRKFIEDLKKREAEAKETKTNHQKNEHPKNQNQKTDYQKKEHPKNDYQESHNTNYTPKTFDEKSSNLGVKIKWSKNYNLIFTKEIINSYFKPYGTVEEIRIDENKCLATLLFLSEKSVDSLLSNFANDETLAKLFKIKKCTNKEVEEKPIVIDTKTLEIIKNMKMMKNVEFMNTIDKQEGSKPSNDRASTPSQAQGNYLLKSLEELEEIAFKMLKHKIKI